MLHSYVSKHCKVSRLEGLQSNMKSKGYLALFSIEEENTRLSIGQSSSLHWFVIE